MSKQPNWNHLDRERLAAAQELYDSRVTRGHPMTDGQSEACEANPIRPVRTLDDPVEYRRVMSYPLAFDVYARTDNLEEYTMRIVAKSEDQAEGAAFQLCSILGLSLMAVAESDEANPIESELDAMRRKIAYGVPGLTIREQRRLWEIAMGVKSRTATAEPHAS